MDIVNELIVQAAASPWIPLAVFALALIDGFFPPVPGETLLVAAAAVAASTGEPQLMLICALAAAGAFIGDNVAYRIGRAVGIQRFRWMRHPRAVAASDRARMLLQGSAATPLIFGARYVPVGRVAVNMTAGALGFSVRRFAWLSGFAGIAWAIYGTALGALAGSWLTDQPLLGAAVAVILATVIAVAYERFAARRRKRAAPNADPAPAAVTAPAVASPSNMGG